MVGSPGFEPRLIDNTRRIPSNCMGLRNDTYDLNLSNFHILSIHKHVYSEIFLK